ncbi:MAG: bis(5'-nucleosyl)-tetraphosphatase (symmetrical) YqeK [Eubacterium sp.]|nr:bis(5'-nucleosyl)-tetraphosphatase (symmetrical) YqeK [Eubacterium sp.]
MYDFEKYEKLIEDGLSEYRFHHSMCVAEKARQLAVKYGADADKAYLAGILHDVTKEMPKDEQISLIEKFDRELTDVERANHRVLHQMSGAVYVKNILGINDKEIIGGIRYHTTGRADMTLFEKVIYIADFTSADRSYPDVDIMREKAERSLDEAMLYSLKYTIREVVKQERALHPDTLNCYNSIINAMN